MKKALYKRFFQEDRFDRKYLCLNCRRRVVRWYKHQEKKIVRRWSREEERAGMELAKNSGDEARREGKKHMGWDIRLKEPVGDETIEFEQRHFIRGGNYVQGGTREAWLHITYNYGAHFYHTLGEKGIRVLYRKTGAESIPILKKAMAELKNNVSENYWEPTEGNAKKALAGLLAFAQMRPDGIWDGD